MEPTTVLKLEVDISSHQNFVFNSIQSLRMSDHNLTISCADGGTVFTNKKYLGVYCTMIKDICKEFPEQENLTVTVEFMKQSVEMMLEYFNTGELKSDNFEALNEVLSLIQILGVNTDDLELIEVIPSKKQNRKRKSEAIDPEAEEGEKIPKKNNKKVKTEPLVNDVDGTLDETVKYTDGGGKEHKCQHCGKGFSVMSSLTAHLVTHTKQKPFQCKECGKFFSSQGALYNHGGVHNPSQCHLCDRTFAQKASLNHHINTVHFR